MEPIQVKNNIKDLKRGSVLVGTKTKKTVKMYMELNIRFVHLEASDDTPVAVNWVSGKKSQMTKTKQFSNNSAKINGKFAMNTSLEFDLLTGKYSSKMTRFEVMLGEGDDAKKVGVAELNLASYTETANTIEKLKLEPIIQEDEANEFTLSKDATIEVRIITKDLQEQSTRKDAPATQEQEPNGSFKQSRSSFKRSDTTPSAKLNAEGDDSSNNANHTSQISQVTFNPYDSMKSDKRRESTMSMTSEQITFLRTQFNIKEANYRSNVRDLESKIQEAREQMKESTLELSLTFDKKTTEYTDLNESDREDLLKKDVQIQLLRDRIKEIESKKVTLLRASSKKQYPTATVSKIRQMRKDRDIFVQLIQKVNQSVDQLYITQNSYEYNNRACNNDTNLSHIIQQLVNDEFLLDSDNIEANSNKSTDHIQKYMNMITQGS